MIFFLFVCSLLSLVFSLPLLARDVWVPKITSPVNTTIWTVGGTYQVTWNTSSMPKQVTNPVGQVYLRINNRTQSTPLAEGFPLAAGRVDVTVPAGTQPSNDWIVVLFGDSGNWSPEFTIASALSS